MSGESQRSRETASPTCLCFRRCCLFGLLAGILTACAPQPPAAPALPAAAKAPIEAAPADFPDAYYRQAEALGERVWRVDPARSLVAIEVRRAGLLAHLGHDHVVVSHEVQGYVAPDKRRADLFVRLDRLVVDEPELRAAAGFDTQPSPEAIDGTRNNMLERVLETAHFPFALIHVTADAEDAGLPEGPTFLRLAITLHGAKRDFRVPVQIETLTDGIAVGGRLSFRQTDFAIVPLSVFGGALQVRDVVDLRFRIVALRG